MTVEELIKRKKALGYSNEQIAELSGVPFGTVQKIFGKQTKAPRAETLRKLEKVLFGQLYSFSTGRYIGEYFGEAPFVYGTGAERLEDDLLEGDDLDENPDWINEGVIARSFMPRKKQGEYTVEDLKHLPLKVNAELIDGVVYDLAALSPGHQAVAFEITRQLDHYIDENNGDCIASCLPFGVVISDNTELNPDVTIICEHNEDDGKLNETIPNFAVEVLSPSTRKYDINDKMRKFLQSGVQEFWLIDHKKEQITTYTTDGTFKFYTFDDMVPVALYGGKLKIDFNKVRNRIKKIQMVLGDKANE